MLGEEGIHHSFDVPAVGFAFEFFHQRAGKFPGIGLGGDTELGHLLPGDGHNLFAAHHLRQVRLNDGKFQFLGLGEFGAAAFLELLYGVLALARGALQHQERFVVGEELIGLTLLGDDFVRHCGHERAERSEPHFIVGAERFGNRFLQSFVDCHVG